MGLKSLWAMLVFCLCAVTQGAETNVMRTISKENFGGIDEPRQVVITNRAAWEKVWAEHNARKEPKESAPRVDFEKESVIVVAQGQKPTGGYSIEVADVQRKDDKATILVKTRTPKPGGLTIQAFTSPVHIVAVPKLRGKVEFKVE